MKSSPALIFIIFMAAVFAVIVFDLSPASASDEIYSYIDEEGVAHFSNNPVDRRYKLLEQKRMTVHKSMPREGYYDEHIVFYSSLYDVDPAFIKAVIKAESDFDPAAMSSNGAIGLMQLMPQTAKNLGVKNPYDPQDNINGGVKYLSRLLEEFNSFSLAAAAYNAGENNVRKYGGVPPFNQTRNFVSAVLNYHQDYLKVGFGQDKIYRVERKDGVIVYTNQPWLYQKHNKP